MKSFKNHVQLIGLVGKVLGINESAQHKKIAKFTLITIESYEIKKEKVTESQCHLIICKGHNAEIFENMCESGSEILITGKINYRKLDNKYITEIQMNDMLVLHKASDKKEKFIKKPGS